MSEPKRTDAERTATLLDYAIERGNRWREEARAAQAKVTRVQALLADETGHLHRWIDDSCLIDVTRVRSALDGDA